MSWILLKSLVRQVRQTSCAKQSTDNVEGMIQSQVRSAGEDIEPCIGTVLEAPRRVFRASGRVSVSALRIHHDMHERVVALGIGENDHERYERHESMNLFEEERRVWREECDAFAR
jgi:hypothetical protein